MFFSMFFVFFVCVSLFILCGLWFVSGGFLLSRHEYGKSAGLG